MLIFLARSALTSADNIFLKLSDDFGSEKFICMKKNTLIKINKSNDYKLLNEIIQKEKIFLLCDKKKYYIAYGDYLISSINKNQIKNILFFFEKRY